MVLDEPLAALDTITQAAAIDLLESIQATTGVAFLLISHDPHTVGRLAHRIVTLRGRTRTPQTGSSPLRSSSAERDAGTSAGTMPGTGDGDVERQQVVSPREGWGVAG